MNWFFACSCKFRKAWSNFNDSRVNVVKIGHGHFVYETLKSAEWVSELSWFFACWLWCNNFWSDHHYTLYLWLLNASLLKFYLLNPWRYLEGSYEIGSVHLYLLTPVWVFSWNWIIKFLWILAWRQKPLSWTLNNWISWKNFFCRKNWGNESNMAKKYSFLNLKKNLIINFHCIYFILKIFICCVRAQIYLGKSCSWDIGQNPLSQSDCRISKWTISPEQIDETVSFLACWYGQSGLWTQSWINQWN